MRVGKDASRREFPPRPPVPATFVAAVVIWLGIALGFWGACQICPDAITPQVPAGIASLGSDEPCVVIATQDARVSAYGGMQCTVEVVGPDGQRCRMYGHYEGRRLLANERVRARLEISEVSPIQAQRALTEGVCAQVRLYDLDASVPQGPFAVVLSFRRWAVERMSLDQSTGMALLRAVLMGDRGALSESGLYEDVKVVGLAHMVAVSGAHLSIVGAGIGLLLGRMNAPRRMKVGVLSGVYAVYALFTGLSAPVLRAALMSLVGLCSVFAGRRAAPLSNLGACVCLLLLVNPRSALSVSFLLSALSTAGIVLLTPLLESWLQAAFGARFGFLIQSLALTLAANFIILPVTVELFSRFSLISPLSNLMAAPVFVVLIVGGFVSLVLCGLAPPLGDGLVWLMTKCADLFCSLVHLMACVPCASVPLSGNGPVLGLALGCGVCALWILWPQARGSTVRWVMAGLLVCGIIGAGVSLRLAPDRIVCCDVGQGDAILITSGSSALLVDTGQQDEDLLAALARAGVFHLDGVVITHPDADHCASLPALRPLLSGGVVFVADGLGDCQCQGCQDLRVSITQDTPAEMVELGLGQCIKVGRFSCQVIGPREFEDGGNGDSLCLLVSHDANGDGRADSRVLLTGDAEAEQIEDMLADNPDLAGVDVFKAGHHGSRAGITPELACALDPSICLISVGAHNRYGHPAESTLQAFFQAGADVYRTDLSGDITCVCREEGIVVYT